MESMDTDTLGYVMKIPRIIREDIQCNYPQDNNRREQLIKYYLQTHPRASWELLGGELLFNEEHSALEKVKVHIRHEQGKDKFMYT